MGKDWERILAERWKSEEGKMARESNSLLPPENLSFAAMERKAQGERKDWWGTGVLAVACAGFLFLLSLIPPDVQGPLDWHIQRLVQNSQPTIEAEGEDFFRRVQKEWGLQKGLSNRK
jgi:hypothetical protein